MCLEGGTLTKAMGSHFLKREKESELMESQRVDMMKTGKKRRMECLHIDGEGKKRKYARKRIVSGKEKKDR